MSTKRAMLGIALKIICIILLFIALVVGCLAHFKSTFFKEWKKMSSAERELAVAFGAPPNAVLMEEVFLGITGMCLVISVAMMLASFLKGDAIQNCEAGYYIVAGILLFIGGGLMIYAAKQIDDFIRLSGLSLLSDETKKERRAENKIYNKFGAGALAILSGILYVINSCVIGLA